LLPRSTLGPRAARPTVASLAAFLLALPFACDSAFKGGTTTAGSGASLTFEFGGGGSQSDAVQGDPVELKILVPRIGFARLLDPITLAIDPARLELTADRAIGDPAQGGFAAGESLTQFAIAQGWTSVLEPPGTVREIHVAADTATPLLFPAGLMHLSLGVTDVYQLRTVRACAEAIDAQHSDAALSKRMTLRIPPSQPVISVLHDSHDVGLTSRQ